jgi:hypothetical protein
MLAVASATNLYAAAVTEVTDSSRQATMNLAAFDHFKPQHLNNPVQKDVIKQSINDLNTSGYLGFGHLENKICQIQQLIAISDAGHVLPEVNGVAITRRPMAGTDVIDLFALTESDLQIPGVTTRLLIELQSSIHSESYRTQQKTREVVDFWLRKVSTDSVPTQGHQIPTWNLAEYTANISRLFAASGSAAAASGTDMVNTSVNTQLSQVSQEFLRLAEHQRMLDTRAAAERRENSRLVHVRLTNGGTIQMTIAQIRNHPYLSQSLPFLRS